MMKAKSVLIPRGRRGELTFSKDHARRRTAGGVLRQEDPPLLLSVPPLHENHAIGRQDLPASLSQQCLNEMTEG